VHRIRISWDCCAVVRIGMTFCAAKKIVFKGIFHFFEMGWWVRKPQKKQVLIFWIADSDSLLKSEVTPYGGGWVWIDFERLWAAPSTWELVKSFTFWVKNFPQFRKKVPFDPKKMSKLMFHNFHRQLDLSGKRTPTQNRKNVKCAREMDFRKIISKRFFWGAFLGVQGDSRFW